MAGKEHLVSIVIPTYGGARFIARTLASALSQTYPCLEIVVVDDGSTDGTDEIVRDIAKNDGRLSLVKQENGGIASARNTGFACTDLHSDYIMFLDHDDLLEPDAVQVLVRALSRRDDCVAAHGQTLVIDEHDEVVTLDGEGVDSPGMTRRRLSSDSLGAAFRPAVTCDTSEDTTFSTLIYTNCIASVGAAIFRRSVLDKVGLFKTEYVPGDDWELYLRVSADGPFCYVPQPVLRWRRHGANTSSNIEKMRQAHQRTLLSIAVSKALPSVRRQIRSMTLYRVVAMAHSALFSHKKNPNSRNDLLSAMRIAVRHFLHV